MRQILILFGALLCMLSCKMQTAETPADDKRVSHIYLQPYDTFTKAEAKKLIPQIEQTLGKMYAGEWTVVEVLDPKPLPKSAYYAPRQRYVADGLLQDLPSYPKGKYTIGLTHKDISTGIHGSKNYGIMGLTTVGGTKTIVSDYRTRREGIVTVIAHEFGHGYFAARHCKDSSCLMCDFQALPKNHKYHSLGLCKTHSYMRGEK